MLCYRIEYVLFEDGVTWLGNLNFSTSMLRTGATYKKGWYLVCKPCFNSTYGKQNITLNKIY